MSTGIRDLKLWQEAVTLASEVIRTLRAANRREIKTVIEDALRCASAIAMHIARGYSQYDPASQYDCYTAARCELAQLETHLAIAREADLLSVSTYQAISSRMAQVHRLLGGYLIYLDRQRPGTSARPSGGEPRVAAPAVP